MIDINPSYFAKDHDPKSPHWDIQFRQKTIQTGYNEITLSDALWPYTIKEPGNDLPESVRFDWESNHSGKMDDDGLVAGMQNESRDYYQHYYINE